MEWRGFKMNIFETIKNIYQKNNKEISNIERWECIALNKWLSFDKDNLNILNKLLPYLFYVEPKHYYYLLFFNIPKKYKVPYLKYIKGVDKKEDKFINKVEYILGWSKKEMDKNLRVVKQVINKKEWQDKIGG